MVGVEEKESIIFKRSWSVAVHHLVSQKNKRMRIRNEYIYKRYSRFVDKDIMNKGGTTHSCETAKVRWEERRASEIEEDVLPFCVNYATMVAFALVALLLAHPFSLLILLSLLSIVMEKIKIFNSAKTLHIIQ
jgi:hypothetical protein